MNEPVSRAIVDAFCKAYATRDAAKVADFIADDVVWTVSGPIDVLPFCGTFRGKAEVLDLIGRRVPSVLRVISFVPASIVVDGDQVAFGVPSGPSSANTGFVTPAVITNTLNCLTKLTGCNTIKPAKAYPTFRGAMTWSINWDRHDGYNFSAPVGPYLHSLP